MPVILTDKEVNEAGRLGRCLDSEIVPIGDIKKFLKAIREKTETPGLPVRKERVKKKVTRKNDYRAMIAAGIHGNKKTA